MKFLLGVVVMMVLLGSSINAYGAINQHSWREISNINSKGPYIGIVVPNAFELNPLLQSSSFVPHNKFPYFDFAGRHFRIGELEKKKVIVVMTGESMRFGEDIGDFRTELGYLKFANYNNYTKHSKSEENLLNKVWYQPERIFPVDGTPEIWQPAFWVPVDKTYFEIARKLKNVELSSCVNTTCLPRKPIVVRVKKGVSASVFVDNKAYRDHLNCKFDATPTDMESAAVALVCFQHKIPFINCN